MNLSYIQVVARYHAKLLRRSWMYRLFVVIAFLYVLLAQLGQSTIILSSHTLSNSLASYLPSINIAVYNLLVIFPVIFLAGGFLSKSRKLDSMDIIFARPVSNAEYLWGICWGVTCQLLIIGGILIFMASMIHLLGSDSPFSPALYLFFFITLLIPTIVFALGFSLLLQRLIPNRAVNILLLLGFIYVVSVYISPYMNGIFDPFGMSLATTFSGITGHSDLWGFVMQRLCWLLIGGGLIGITIIAFKRLPNHPRFQGQKKLLTAGSLLLGLLCGLYCYTGISGKKQLRQDYSAVYAQYRKSPKLTLISQYIDYTQHGNKMEVTSRLTLENRHPQLIQEGLLYLNPGLKINEITIEGKPVSFEQERQVVKVRSDFRENQPVRLEIRYSGKIDPEVCYLDVPEKQVLENKIIGNNVAGNRFAFLQKRFTLLIPEVLWYPTPIPPVDPVSPYDPNPVFADFSLSVGGTGNETVISQGSCTEENGRHLFTNSQPLSGISLLIGPYKKYMTEKEGITYELYLFRENHTLDVFTHIHDTLPGLLPTIMGSFEYIFNKDYPFKALKLVETPITFSSYYRNTHLQSEQIQPEMILFPEKGAGVVDFKGKLITIMEQPTNIPRNELETEIIAFNSFINNTLKDEYGAAKIDNTSIIGMIFRQSGNINVYQEPNPLYLAPLFFNYSGSVSSASYPILSQVFNLLERKKDQPARYSSLNSKLNTTLEKAIDYFRENSFESLLHKREIKPHILYEIVRLKADELHNWILASGISDKEIINFLEDFSKKYAFQVVDFAHFEEALHARFGLNLHTYIPDWYSSSSKPAFIIQNLVTEKIDISSEEQNTTQQRYRIQWEIMNTGNAEGVIEVNTIRTPQQGSMQQSEGDHHFCYLLKEGEAKRIAITTTQPHQLRINTNISGNIPSILTFSTTSVGTTSDTSNVFLDISPDLFRPDPHEIIVDNEDEGFIVHQQKSGKKIHNWMKKESSPEKIYQKGITYSNRDRWNLLSNSAFHGRTVNSAIAKVTGEGKASVSWKTNLPEAGTYDIYVYLPDRLMQRHNMNYLILQSAGGNIITSSGNYEIKQESQYYNLMHNNENEEIILDTKGKYQWTLLGRFKLSEGPHEVILSDRGEEFQIIYADAVKWVQIKGDGGK